MTKKIVLLLMASMLVLAVGCKEKTDQEEANPSEPTINEEEAPVEETTGKYKSPSKEDALSIFEQEGFVEITEGVETNEFMYEHLNGEERTTFKFIVYEDKIFEVVVDEVKEYHTSTDTGFFHTETRTDENGFYYSAPLFSEEDVFKADIIVNGTHIMTEGNYDLVQTVLKALNLPSEEISLDMVNPDEAPIVGEPSDESVEEPFETQTESPVEDENASENADESVDNKDESNEN